MAYLLPEEPERDVLMRVIYDGVKQGSPLEPMEEAFRGVLAAMNARGADFFILGCTELPLAFSMLHITDPAVDPTEELARRAIAFCGYGLRPRR